MTKLTSFLAILACTLIVAMPETATAQIEPSGYVSVMGRPNFLPKLAPFINRTFVPVDVRELSGPNTLKPDEAGLFIAQVNLESASLPLRSRWDFGDGTTAAGLSARHAFARPGTYTVSFHLWNGQSEDADSLQVTVTPLRSGGDTLSHSDTPMYRSESERR